MLLQLFTIVEPHPPQQHILRSLSLFVKSTPLLAKPSSSSRHGTIADLIHSFHRHIHTHQHPFPTVTHLCCRTGTHGWQKLHTNTTQWSSWSHNHSTTFHSSSNDGEMFLPNVAIYLCETQQSCWMFILEGINSLSLSAICPPTQQHKSSVQRRLHYTLALHRNQKCVQIFHRRSRSLLYDLPNELYMHLFA